MWSAWTKPSLLALPLPPCGAALHVNTLHTQPRSRGIRVQRSISTRCAPRASSARPAGAAADPLKGNSRRRLEQLERFIATHGHPDVPHGHPDGLGAWIASQRHRWRRGRLPPPLFRALTAAGVAMDGGEARWAARFAQLADFHSRHGHCCVPHAGPTAPPGLYAWTLVQRQRWRQGRLGDSRARRLDGIAFPWDVAAARNAERVAELEAFQAQHGHGDVPRRWRGNPKLARWLETLSERAHTLTEAQRNRLRKLGWGVGAGGGGARGRGLPWAARLEQLRALRTRQGHLSGRLPNTGAFAGLRTWAEGVRKRRRRGALPPERAAELEALEFEFDPREAAFARRLDAVDAEIAARGLPGAYVHLVLLGVGVGGRRRGRRPSAAAAAAAPTTVKPSELGRWVARVRRAARTGGLSGEAAEALAARGLLPAEAQGPELNDGV